jgi:hypothetical protein
MFEDTVVFDQDLSTWDVSSAVSMAEMFREAAVFDSDLSEWDVSGVEDTSYMFYQARAFSGDVSSWDVSNIKRMNAMLQQAASFDHSLASWDISHKPLISGVLSYSGISTANYDATLSGWLSRGSVPRDVEFRATGLTYCEAADARATLIAEYGWTFEGDTLSCDE